MPLRAASIMSSYAEWGFCGFPLSNIILRGRWMLESDWLTTVLRCEIIFRETNGERSSRPLLSVLHVHITSPNDFSYFKDLTTAKYPKPKDTGQTNKYSKQYDKNDRSFPRFCHKITFYYVWKAHTLSLRLSLLHTSTYKQFAHTRTYIALFWRFYQ